MPDGAAPTPLTIPITREPTVRWTKTQQRFLEVLEHEEHRCKTVAEICRLAGFKYDWYWYLALKDERFVAKMEELGVPVRRGRQHAPPHTEVTLALDIEWELAQDVWDMRRLKTEYPKHQRPAAYIADFRPIPNPVLRGQVKAFFRAQLPRWKCGTFSSALRRMLPLLLVLPPDVHVGVLRREHIEALLPHLYAQGNTKARYTLIQAKAMLNYMATSPAWTQPRPPRFLIWPEDLPGLSQTLPRPIPPDVVDQLDGLLGEAVSAMVAGREPALLRPTFWDAILILRHTGMRFEDLAHLKSPDAQGRDGCLVEDSDGYWWVRIEHDNTKMGRDHRTPTRHSDGVVDAIRRQRGRVEEVPDYYRVSYLFRTPAGVLRYEAFFAALRRLSGHLTHEGEPYAISPHQFRHTIATDMIEQGVDIYTVKEFLGHSSLKMTEKYVKVYLSSLKAKFDDYRVKAQSTGALELIVGHVTAERAGGSDADGGWMEGRVGQLYRSPLPSGEGNCHHLAMLDPCPTPPVCGTCVKLHADKRHLPTWESKVTNLKLTVEALSGNPAFERARRKHEQELRHAERVVATIKREGYWDGRIHNLSAGHIELQAIPSGAVSSERTGEVGGEARGDAWST